MALDLDVNTHFYCLYQQNCQESICSDITSCSIVGEKEANTGIVQLKQWELGRGGLQGNMEASLLTPQSGVYIQVSMHGSKSALGSLCNLV